MASMNLSVVTPTGAVVDTEISEATLPGAAGVFGVYPQHQPSLIMLGGGIMTFVGVEGEGELLIRGGVAEISGDSLLVITDHALEPSDADREEAEGVLQGAIAELEAAEFLDDSTLLRLSTDQRYAETVLKTAGH
jgi:F-type H+-transporting ATPase subunit epsilon